MRSTTSNPSIAVVIGRFQPPHKGHVDLLNEGLAAADQLVVVLGSSFQARSPKNPFTWTERQEMIKLALAGVEKPVHFLPIRDYYDDTRWVTAVREGLSKMFPTTASVTLVGHKKDATSYYLDQFPGWKFQESRRFGEVEATPLRRILLGGIAAPSALAAMAEHVPDPIVEYLRAWSLLPFRQALTEEWAQIRSERLKWAQSPYPPIFSTADALVTCQEHVLLIRRKNSPGAKLWALPGGFVEENERLMQAALRELEEETGLRLMPSTLGPTFQGVRVFDHPQRSLRGRTITHVHRIDLTQSRFPDIRPGSDAMDAQWVHRNKLLQMECEFFEDHFSIQDSYFGLT